MTQTTTKHLTGAQLLVEALKSEKVDYIFGYPGGAVLPLYDAFYDGDIPHILTRHEQGAVHAAEGYARVSGKPGVVVVTSGPGATNAITGIADAMSDSLPLVVITGQVHRPGIGLDAFQEADLLSMTTPITKHNFQIHDPSEIAQTVKEAFHIANSGRKGPVVIDFPKDMGILTADLKEPNEVDLPGYQLSHQVSKEKIELLLNMLNASTKPLILAGAGVHFANASQPLLTFSSLYDIPVVSTLHGLGSVPNTYPLFLGMGGMHGSYAANMALSECDLLINFGSRFDDRLASDPNTFAHLAKVVHVDIDASEINKIIQTDLGIHANALDVLTLLLKYEPFQVNHQAWLNDVTFNKVNYPLKPQGMSDWIRPQEVIQYIGELTNGEALVTTDVGQHQMWTAQFYPFKHSSQFITSGGLGTMGFGIPAAIGAQLANPKKTVVAFVGDGGFQMTNQELAILNEYNLPIKTVLLNNGTLGMVKQWQHKFFNERYSASVFNSQPDFMKLTEAYHLKSFLITDPKTYKQHLDEAFNYEGPTVIEIRISPTEMVLPMVPSGQPNHMMEGYE